MYISERSEAYWPDLGLDSTSTSLGLVPQSFGFVLALTHSGIGLDLV